SWYCSGEIVVPKPGRSGTRSPGTWLRSPTPRPVGPGCPAGRTPMSPPQSWTMRQSPLRSELEVSSSASCDLHCRRIGVAHRLAHADPELGERRPHLVCPQQVNCTGDVLFWKVLSSVT